MPIHKHQLSQMFGDAVANPKVKWDIYGECLWGYFFTDARESKLVRAAEALEALNYRVVGLLRPAADAASQELILHVDRIEVHTPDSLHARNLQFYQFAAEYELGSYDGMDVGPAQSAPDG